MNAISDSSESPPDEATVGGSSALEVPLAIPPSPAPCSESKEHLAVPLYVPSRTSSPGSLSVLSLDEWQMLNGTGKHGPTSHLSTWRLKFEKFWVRNLGLFYMLLAQVFGTAMNVTTRFLEVQGNKGKGMDPFQVLFARMGITVVLATAYMTYKKTPYFPFGMPEVRWLLVARGMGGFFGVFGMYYSLQYLPISDATVLTYLARGLTCWACSFLINEPFSRIEKIGTFISLGGVIFIARPTSLISFGSTDSQATHPGAGNSTHTGDASDFDSITPHERIKAVGVAMIGVLGAVAAYTTIRWIGKRAHPLISVNYFATWCTLVSLVMQIAVPSIGFLFPADLKEWALLIFLG
ncbi:hypothetical protein ANO11243_009280 [Dothideomycetidae sp. 11243]|nr:hypothetical protein ANO11243_009280 [fungal sp. No.11243]